ncbi:hypothetical protein Tco_1052968 [Tanacetum coccineum]
MVMRWLLIKEWRLLTLSKRSIKFTHLKTQKAKVNWSIEGDENTSFFHGMLNKKRRQQNIRGIMIDGIWIDNPIRVKDEFFNTLVVDLINPMLGERYIEMRYPKTITCDQQADLERDVSNEEIRGVGYVDSKFALRSSRVSIIINGSPTKEFQFFKGLKLGESGWKEPEGVDRVEM